MPSKRKKWFSSDYRTIIGFVLVGLVLVAVLISQSDTVKSLLLRGGGKENQSLSNASCSSQYWDTGRETFESGLLLCNWYDANPPSVRGEGEACDLDKTVKCCTAVDGMLQEVERPIDCNKDKGLKCVKEPGSNDVWECKNPCDAFAWEQGRKSGLPLCTTIDTVSKYGGVCGEIYCCYKGVDDEGNQIIPEVRSVKIICDPAAVDKAGRGLRCDIPDRKTTGQCVINR